MQALCFLIILKYSKALLYPHGHLLVPSGTDNTKSVSQFLQRLHTFRFLLILFEWHPVQAMEYKTNWQHMGSASFQSQNLYPLLLKTPAILLPALFHQFFSFQSNPHTKGSSYQDNLLQYHLPDTNLSSD